MKSGALRVLVFPDSGCVMEEKTVKLTMMRTDSDVQHSSRNANQVWWNH